MRADEGRCAREVDEVQLQRMPAERRVRRLPHLRDDATPRCQLQDLDMTAFDFNAGRDQ